MIINYLTICNSKLYNKLWIFYYIVNTDYIIKTLLSNYRMEDTDQEFKLATYVEGKGSHSQFNTSKLDLHILKKYIFDTKTAFTPQQNSKILYLLSNKITDDEKNSKDIALILKQLTWSSLLLQDPKIWKQTVQIIINIFAAKTNHMYSIDLKQKQKMALFRLVIDGQKIQDSQVIILIKNEGIFQQIFKSCTAQNSSYLLELAFLILHQQKDQLKNSLSNKIFQWISLIDGGQINIGLSFFIARRFCVLFGKQKLTIEFITFALKYCILKYEHMMITGKIKEEDKKFIYQTLNVILTRYQNQTIFNKFYLTFVWSQLKCKNLYYLLKIHAYNFHNQVFPRIQKILTIQINEYAIKSIINLFIGIPFNIPFDDYKNYCQEIFMLIKCIKERKFKQSSESLIFLQPGSYVQKKATKKMSVKIQLKVGSSENQFMIFQFIQPNFKSIIQVWQIQNWRISNKHDWTVKYAVKHFYIDKSQKQHKYKQKKQLTKVKEYLQALQQTQNFIIRYEDKKLVLKKVQTFKEKQERQKISQSIIFEEKFNLQMFTIGKSHVQIDTKTSIYSIKYLKDEQSEDKQERNRKKRSNITQINTKRHKCEIKTKKSFSAMILDCVNLQAIIFHNLQHILRSYTKLVQKQGLQKIIYQNLALLYEVTQSQTNNVQKMCKIMLMNIISKNAKVQDKSKFIEVCFDSFCDQQIKKQENTNKTLQNQYKLVNNTRFYGLQFLENAVNALKYVISKGPNIVKQIITKNQITKYYLDDAKKIIFYLFAHSKKLDSINNLQKSMEQLFLILKLIFVNELLYESQEIINFIKFLVTLTKFQDKLKSSFKNYEQISTKSSIYQVQNKSCSSKLDMESNISTYNWTQTDIVSTFKVQSDKYLIYLTAHLIKQFLQQNLDKFKKKAKQQELIQVLKYLRNQIKQICISLFKKCVQIQKISIAQIQDIFKQNGLDPQDVQALPIEVFRKHLQEKGEYYKFYKFQQFIQAYLLLGKITQQDNLLNISAISQFSKNSVYYPSYLWKIFINALWKHEVPQSKNQINKDVIQHLAGFEYVLLSNQNTVGLFDKYMKSKNADFITQFSWSFIQRLSKLSPESILSVLNKYLLLELNQSEMKIVLQKTYVIIYRVSKITCCNFSKLTVIKDKINRLFHCLLWSRKLSFMTKNQVQSFFQNDTKQQQFIYQVNILIQNLKKLKQNQDSFRCEILQSFIKNLQIQKVEQLTETQLCIFKQGYITKQIQTTIQNWCSEYVSDILIEHRTLLEKQIKPFKKPDQTKTLKKTISKNQEKLGLNVRNFEKQQIKNILQITELQIKRIKLIKKQNQVFDINCSLTWQSYNCQKSEENASQYYVVDNYCDPNNFRPFIKRSNKKKAEILNKNGNTIIQNPLQIYKQQLCEIKNNFSELLSEQQNTNMVSVDSSEYQSSVKPQTLFSKRTCQAIYITNQKFYQGKISLDEKGVMLTFTQNIITNQELYKQLQTLDSQKRTKIQIAQKRMVLNINLKQNCHIVKKSYLKLQNSIQIYVSSFTYFFRFFNKQIRKQFLKYVQDSERKIVDHNMATIYQQKWLRGAISNFQYLMKLNEQSQRSFNDISQYYVFPWTVSNFTAETIDQKFLKKQQNFRQLSYPMGKINPDRFQNLKNRYEMSRQRFQQTDIFLYGSFYSNPAIICYYLLRLHPFSLHHYRLQGGKFDHADRLFRSIQKMYQCVYSNGSDFKELIPEFYCSAQFLKNRNKYKLGETQKHEIVDHVILPRWVKTQTPQEFVFKMKKFLQCQIVTKKLNNWIDLIFGIYNLESRAKQADNVFSQNVYRITNYQNDLKSLSFCNTYLKEFGQMPQNIYLQKHPKNFIAINLKQIKENKEPAFQKLLKKQKKLAKFAECAFELCDDIRVHQLQVILLNKNLPDRLDQKINLKQKIQIFSNFILINSGNLISFMAIEGNSISVQNCSIISSQQKKFEDCEATQIKSDKQLQQSYLFTVVNGEILAKRIYRKSLSIFEKSQINLKQQKKISDLEDVTKIISIFEYLIVVKSSTINFYSNNKSVLYSNNYNQQKQSAKIGTNQFTYYENQKFYSANNIKLISTNQFLSLFICIDQQQKVTLFDIRTYQLIKIRESFKIETLTFQQSVIKFQIHNMGYILFWTNKNRIIMTNILGQMIINSKILFQVLIQGEFSILKNISNQKITSVCFWSQQDSQILIGSSQGYIYKVDIFDLASRREPQGQIKKVIFIEEAIISRTKTQNIHLGKQKNKIKNMKMQRFGRHWRLYCVINYELFVVTSQLFVETKLYSALADRERDK